MNKELASFQMKSTRRTAACKPLDAGMAHVELMGIAEQQQVEGASVFRPGMPTFDLEEFRDFIDEIDDATEEEKIEYLQLLWKIAITFVDISFGVDSTQLVARAATETDPPAECHPIQGST